MLAKNIEYIKNIKEMNIDKYFIAKSQDLDLIKSSAYKSKNDKELLDYCNNKKITILRDYQLKAIKSVQSSIIEGNERFLLEMATGTGKTLVSAGIIKMFIKSKLADRILFLVDRIELENQAKEKITQYFAQEDNIKIVIYKETREQKKKGNWYLADIVISTIQSFMYKDRYKSIFKPRDFDLIISDEAHRNLGGSFNLNTDKFNLYLSRKIFEYFIGYKLGLTATPKNYLKGISSKEENLKEKLNIRMLLDTYSTFGCKNRKATFSYNLIDGVNDKILVNPKTIDIRTDLIQQLIKGITVKKDVVVDIMAFEKSVFSETTNKQLCKVFIDNALKDPITNEIGKSIIFCINIKHAEKITKILNDLANQKFPKKYDSDFAVQITSNIDHAQQMAKKFSNNNLNGYSKWLEGYNSSKTRVAVTVDMMSTGYDCPDILNIALFKPIRSPIQFIQIRGRGTRLYSFKYKNITKEKETFMLFDGFGVLKYFEDKFEYDKALNIPIYYTTNGEGGGEDIAFYYDSDFIISKEMKDIPKEGMKIDRKFYEKFELRILKDPKIQKILKDRDIKLLELYLNKEIFDNPEEPYTIKNLKKSLELDRNLSTKEISMKLLGFIPKYDTKLEKLNKEFKKFFKNKKELNEYIDNIFYIKDIFQAYILDANIRDLIEKKEFAPLFTMYIKESLENLSDYSKKIVFKCISEYVKENNICYKDFK